MGGAMTETKAAALSSCNTNISSQSVFSSKVVQRELYFTSPPTGLRQQQRRYFTLRLKLDVDFAIEGAINNHRHKDHRLKESLPGKPHFTPLAHFSRADRNLSSINFSS